MKLRMSGAFSLRCMSRGVSVTLVLLALLIPGRARATDMVLIGPTFHFNFGNGGHVMSYGVEASYWRFLGILPYGVDAGIEIGSGRFSLYSEAQTGIGLAGFSMGPLLEIKKGTGVSVGIQKDVWINYIGGADFRWKAIDQKTYYAVGLYGKAPLMLDGEWVDYSNGSGSSNHHIDEWHWHH